LLITVVRGALTELHSVNNMRIS